MHQLPLAVQLGPEGDFADYLSGPNAEAVAAVTAWSQASGDPFLYLFGPRGTGKTHLLQAACRAAVARGASAIYLPLSHPGLSPSALDGLEGAELIALDDVQLMGGDAGWEAALFGLFNRLREADRRLLMSGDAPVPELSLDLPDLRSRIGWGPAYRLRGLGEGDCERLLRESAARRGLELGADVIAYVMTRCPRDAGSLLRLLDRVDRESLRTKRRPSLWLVRRMLEPAD